MARRAGLRSILTPASLALALSILITALAVPAAADSATSPASETTETAQGASSAETTESASATRKAERAARHAERAEAEAGAPANDPAAESGAATTGTAGKGATGSSSKAAKRAERAERKAERAARKGPDTGAGTDAKNGASTNASALTTTAKERTAAERERERKRREHEAKQREHQEAREKSGRESYKEKKAREAREAREGEAPQVGGQGAGSSAESVTPIAAGGLASAFSPEARAAAVSAASTRGSDGVRSAKTSSGAKRAGRGRAHASLIALPPAASGAPLAAAAPTWAASRPHARAHHRAPSAKRSSPLVTTVTRIIGVIPGVLWLLIGVLALVALAFAASTRVASRRARRLDRQRRALLEDVGLLQAALLPELPGRLGPVETTAAYRPASGPGAGGDFYDVFALEEGLLAVVVGDVSGHGREALPHTTLLRYTLRAYLEAGLSPREALRAAAPALERQLGGSFATVVLATYDPRERLLTYSCAGHPHPLLTGLDPDAAILAASAPPIGAGRRTGTRQTVVSVPGSALVAFYTDGVIEARTDGELYGQRRLANALGRLAEESRNIGAREVLDRVSEETDRRADDMAACVLGIAGGVQAPRILREELELDGREAGRERTQRFLLAAGVPEDEIARTLASARAIAADHGSALLRIEIGEGTPRLSLTHDNVAPLRARALARTQEVAL